MKQDYLKIFIDRLQNEGEFSQSGELPASILDLSADEALAEPIQYKLSAYIADDHLVMNFDASCQIKLPCKICNEFTTADIQCPKQTYLEPLNDIKKGMFEATSVIREAILLNLPPYIECEGHYPARNDLKKYLKSENKQAEVYQPFQDL